MDFTKPALSPDVPSGNYFETGQETHLSRSGLTWVKYTCLDQIWALFLKSASLLSWTRSLLHLCLPKVWGLAWDGVHLDKWCIWLQNQPQGQMWWNTCDASIIPGWWCRGLARYWLRNLLGVRHTCPVKSQHRHGHWGLICENVVLPDLSRGDMQWNVHVCIAFVVHGVPR